ncbi:MAG: hypothetical protein PHG67_14280 [Bacteroidales bacterium]|nr:hypothetical protein [Bacteroidales bacterium]
MGKFFELNELQSSKRQVVAEDRSQILRDSFLAMHDHKVESLKQLCGNLPKPGEFFALWTLKSFNAFTIIPYMIKTVGRVDYLVLSTYSINTRIVDSLCRKIDQDHIGHVKIFISDSIKNRMPKVVDHLHMMMQSRQQLTVHYAWNHSKITLIEAGGEFYVFEGSGNWSENAQYEQYLFFNHRPLYDFRLKCITHDLYRRTD